MKGCGMSAKQALPKTEAKTGTFKATRDIAASLVGFDNPFFVTADRARLKQIVINLATAHIPVVALSANAMAHDIQMGLEVGFFRYLTKPIRVGEFMDTLNAALEFAEEERHG